MRLRFLKQWCTKLTSYSCIAKRDNSKWCFNTMFVFNMFVAQSSDKTFGQIPSLEKMCTPILVQKKKILLAPCDVATYAVCNALHFLNFPKNIPTISVFLKLVFSLSKF